MTSFRETDTTSVYKIDHYVSRYDGQQQAFRGIASCIGAFWAFGDGILLVSANGTHWLGLTDQLNIAKPFSISAVVGDEAGAFVWARNRDGLNVRRLERGTWSCRELPRVPTTSPGVLAVRLKDALAVCVNQGQRTRFWRLRDSNAEWELLPSSIEGVAVHFELDDMGSGTCAVWGIERDGGIAQPSPSAVYRTTDGAASWAKTQEMDTMLLVGASAEGRPSLLGGIDGYISEETVEGFVRLDLHSSDEVAAVAVDHSQQGLVLASLDLPLIQTLLWRSSSKEWSRLDVSHVGRILGIQFLRFGLVLLCTSDSLHVYRIDLLQ